MTETNPDNTTTTLSQVWHLPLLIVALLLLGIGYFMASPEPEKPDYEGMLGDVETLVSTGEYQSAIDALKGLEVVMPELKPKLQAQWHLLSGDAVAGLQRANKWTGSANFQLIVDRYHDAVSMGEELNAKRLTTLADSLIALGHVDKAEQLVAQFDEQDAGAGERLRRRLLQMAVDRGSNSEEVIRRLHAFATSSPSRENQIWAIARQAELLLRDNEYGAAEDLLSRWLQRFDFEKSNDLGELLVLIGDAMLLAGNGEDAERVYLQAQGMLANSDPLNGDALAGLGRVRYEEGNVVDALKFFSDAVDNYPTTRAYLSALVGKGECQSRLGSYDEAVGSMTLAVDQYQARPENRRSKADYDLLSQSIATQRDWRFNQDQFELALRYLELENRLHGDDLHHSIQLKIAVTHEKIAENMLGAESDEDARERYRLLDASTRAEIASHFHRAGEAYYKHSQIVIANNDVKAYADSLWRAADNYDRAGLYDQAIARFEEYAKSLDADARQLNVKYRLAQAYQAEAQFEIASVMYKEIIELNPKSPEAYASLVPLARCYLTMGTEYLAQAEQVLLAVVTDHEALRPESREYREALLELGRLYYKRGDEGDYVKAIERFDEAVSRYGDTKLLPDVLFQLGDAYRKSVDQIDLKLTQPLAPSERASFEAERATRLAKAQDCFDSVIRVYEAGDTSKLSKLHKLYLRNSYFYRADCAYDLGRYEGPLGAIALYDKAVQRYEKDPAVLIALVQIVNSYCELGQYDKARTANERAKWHLDRIPDEAFNDPSLPMDRDHWRRWLDWTGELGAVDGAAANAAP